MLAIKSGSVSSDKGTISYSNNIWTFTPNSNYSGNAKINYLIEDGKGATISNTITLVVDPVNDRPVRSAGNVGTLNLLEDAARAPMGLAGVTYSAGGGTDEASQDLDFKITALPAATFGKVYKTDGTTDTEVSVNDVLTLPQLQGLKFEATAHANGTANFVFDVIDRGTTNVAGATDKQTLTETLTIDIKAFNDAPELSLIHI